MASRRTISYIGLWALIMPWLGFSWGTKTVLFSLTGILLLFIGNRHYSLEKKKSLNTKKEESTSVNNSATLPEIKEKEPVSVYKPIPEYMATKTATSQINNPVHVYKEESKPELVLEKTEFIPEIKNEEFVPISSFNQETNLVSSSVSFNQDSSQAILEKPKSKLRKKIEMAARPKRTTPKPISLDSLDSEYEQREI